MKREEGELGRDLNRQKQAERDEDRDIHGCKDWHTVM